MGSLITIGRFEGKTLIGEGFFFFVEAFLARAVVRCARLTADVMSAIVIYDYNTRS